MSQIEKLLASVRNNPRDVRFDDLVRLMKALGFVFARQGGSHAIYAHPRTEVPPMNVQPGKNGGAKGYQVEQLLSLIDTYGLEVK